MFQSKASFLCWTTGFKVFRFFPWVGTFILRKRQKYSQFWKTINFHVLFRLSPTKPVWFFPPRSHCKSSYYMGKFGLQKPAILFLHWNCGSPKILESFLLWTYLYFQNRVPSKLSNWFISKKVSSKNFCFGQKSKWNFLNFLLCSGILIN